MQPGLCGHTNSVVDGPRGREAGSHQTGRVTLYHQGPYIQGHRFDWHHQPAAQGRLQPNGHPGARLTFGQVEEPVTLGPQRRNLTLPSPPTLDTKIRVDPSSEPHLMILGRRSLVGDPHRNCAAGAYPADDIESNLFHQPDAAHHTLW